MEAFLHKRRLRRCRRPQPVERETDGGVANAC